MSIVIDVILCLIALAVIIRYTVRGFVKSVMGALTLFLSALAAFFLTPLLFPLSDPVSTAVSYLLIFAASYVALTAVAFLIDKFFKLPVLNFANKLLGLGLGIICAYITLSVSSAVLSLLLSISAEQLFGQTAEQVRNSTYIYQYFSTAGLLPVQ